MKQELVDAHLVAYDAHLGQYRWDGKTPYIVHPEKVVTILEDMGIDDIDILQAAMLHDVIEDSELSLQDLEKKFSNRVVSLVDELTFTPFGNDEDYFRQIGELSKDAALVKIADILANLGDKGKHSEHFIKKRIHALSLLESKLSR